MKVTVILDKNVNYNQVCKKVGEQLEIDEKDLDWFKKHNLIRDVVKKEKSTKANSKSGE